eukprot:6337735-Alexandrium_andersonii.AAC.1
MRGVCVCGVCRVCATSLCACDSVYEWECAHVGRRWRGNSMERSNRCEKAGAWWLTPWRHTGALSWMSRPGARGIVLYAEWSPRVRRVVTG